MSGDTFTVSELAEAVTGGNVMAMTKLLNDAGAQPGIEEAVGDPVRLAAAGRVVVTRAIVVGLYAMRAGSRVGRKLARLLRRGEAGTSENYSDAL